MYRLIIESMLPAVTPQNRLGLPSTLKARRFASRLGNDAHAKALRLQRAADHGHAEAGVVHIRVARHQDDVANCPSPVSPSRRGSLAGTGRAGLAQYGR